MREIPKKNYFILAVLLAVTVLLTLLLSNIYVNKDKLVSSFYEYSNIITPEEFDEFMTENSDIIIYINDRYDLTHETFEKKFKNKVDELNLKHNLIYIDKNDIDKEFLNKLKKIYEINIDLEKTPIVVVVIDKEVIKNVSIENDSNIDTLIEYEAFE
ncbi:MAG: hypothetical protein IKL65_02675 [Bacilli bacterium]|nr:hypothetical protein [Bacilli bacterium]